MDHYLTISIVNVYKTRVRYTSFTYLLYSCQNQQLNLAVLFDMHNCYTSLFYIYYRMLLPTSRSQWKPPSSLIQRQLVTTSTTLPFASFAVAFSVAIHLHCCSQFLPFTVHTRYSFFLAQLNGLAYCRVANLQGQHEICTSNIKCEILYELD